MPLLFLGGAVIFAALFFFSRKATAAIREQETEMNLDSLFKTYAARHGLDWRLLKAIAMVESSLNPEAERINPPHDVSVGLMQILCIPDENGVCTNRFPAVKSWPGTTFESLKDPARNIEVAAEILAWNIRHYGSPRGIAMYNHWGARNARVEGPFPNDSYVNKVMRNYAKLQEEAA